MSNLKFLFKRKILSQRFLKSQGWHNILKFTFTLAVSVSYGYCKNLDKLAQGQSKTTSTLVFSTIYLKELVPKDVAIYRILKEEIGIFSAKGIKAKQLGADIKRFLEDYETSSGYFIKSELEMDGISKIIANPILVIRMLMRFSIDLELILDTLQTLPAARATWHMLKLEAPLDLIENFDVLEEAIERLLQIMLTYDLDVWQVTSGNFQNISTGVRLNENQCREIAEVASNRGYHALAVEWAEVALKLASHRSQQDAIDEMGEFLRHVILKHDAEFTKDMTYRFFTEKLLDGGGYSTRKSASRTRQRQYYGENDFKNSRLLKFYKLCSGENLQEDKKAELSCWYHSGQNPRWMLSPLKVQLISRSPLVLQIYDIMSPRDRQKVIQEAEPDLGYSIAEFSNSNGKRSSLRRRHPLRNSFDVIFRKTHLPEMQRLINRIEDITKYSLGSGGVELQFTAYTYGGSFGVHHDAAPASTANSDPLILPRGNRIATFLVYLTDVEAGGLTAFPELGFAVTPEPGSGLFWFNLKSDENLDEQLYHGACPLIFGNTKWVINMFIRAGPQFPIWKCNDAITEQPIFNILNN